LTRIRTEISGKGFGDGENGRNRARAKPTSLSMKEREDWEVGTWQKKSGAHLNFFKRKDKKGRMVDSRTERHFKKNT